MSEDLQIIQGMEHDPDTAIRQLQQRYGAYVRSVISRQLNDHHTVDDVWQEFWIKVVRFWRNYEPAKGKLGGWLITMASRTAIDQGRKISRLQQIFLEPDPDPDAPEPQHADPGSAEDDLDALELSASLQQALDELPLSQRQIVELYFFSGYSQRQLAEHLDIPLGTVKTRVELAIAALRRIIIPL